MWCEAVEPFWAANPCRKASCYQCRRERLLMCTCSPGGRDSTRPVGTEPVLVLGLKLAGVLNECMSVPIFRSSLFQNRQCPKKQIF